MPRALLSIVLLVGCAPAAATTPPATPGPAGTESAAAEVAPKPKRPLTSFEHKERFGFKDATGAVVIPPRYQAVYEFGPGGIARVLDDSKWYVIDETGEVLFEAFFFDNGPDYTSEGLARFVWQGKVGFHDERGKVVIEPRFDFATPFEGGRAEVCVGCEKRPEGEHFRYEGGQWGVIDRSGAFVVPLH